MSSSFVTVPIALCSREWRWQPTTIPWAWWRSAAWVSAVTAPARIASGCSPKIDDGSILGHAVCIELDDASAELAVEVADRLHGQGLGTI
ncbi:MAG: hypothetical protein WBZ37_25545, partial [Mycobacterium sp.]